MKMDLEYDTEIYPNVMTARLFLKNRCLKARKIISTIIIINSNLFIKLYFIIILNYNNN
jgi:hypothetical protein